MIEEIELKNGAAECQFTFNGGKILKASGASIFDPEVKFEPAYLRLYGVRSIVCEEGPYQLNATVVDFGARLSSIAQYIEFYFDLTGGTDPEAFMVKIKILALRFDFGAAPSCRGSTGAKNIT